MYVATKRSQVRVPFLTVDFLTFFVRTENYHAQWVKLADLLTKLSLLRFEPLPFYFSNVLML